MLLAVGFSVGALYLIEEGPFCFSLLSAFIVMRCWVLSNALHRREPCVLSVRSVNMVYYVGSFSDLKLPLYS